MDEPKREHSVRPSDMFVDAFQVNPPPRYYRGGRRPIVFDGRDVPINTEAGDGTFLTADKIGAKVDKLITDAGEQEGIPVTHVVESEEGIEEFGNHYTARTRNVMGSPLGQSEMPLAWRTEYEMLGVGKFGIKKRGVYRPTSTVGLTGFQSVEPSADPFIIEVTKYVGPDGEIDVYHFADVARGDNVVSIENTHLNSGTQRRIAGLLKLL